MSEFKAYVNFARISWLTVAPVINAQTKPIRIFLLNKRYSLYFNPLV